jgi:streptomycin 6-kinase
LKLILDLKRLNKEAQALKIFSEFGAVSLLAKTETALLLKRIMPGSSLKTYLPKRKEEALHIICRLMKNLHQAPVPESTIFPHIKELLNILDKEWSIPQKLIKKARYLKRKLLQEKQSPVLLHGDLHHSNILSDGFKWWVIDPQGVVGYPINEVWAFIIDPIPDTQFAADYFKFDVKTVREWYFIHLVLMICWNINDNQDPSFFLDLAKKAYSLVQS